MVDVGAGSGLLAVLAARAGARRVRAIDADPYAAAASRLNAEANGVAIEAAAMDAGAIDPAGIEVVLAGDVFYDVDVAKPMLAALDRLRAAGADVLVGDPGRAPLPLRRLQAIAAHDVRDFGDPPGIARQARVYRLTA